jgi:hypothetical protein
MVVVLSVSAFFLRHKLVKSEIVITPFGTQAGYQNALIPPLVHLILEQVLVLSVLRIVKPCPVHQLHLPLPRQEITNATTSGLTIGEEKGKGRIQ